MPKLLLIVLVVVPLAVSVRLAWAAWRLIGLPATAKRQFLVVVAGVLAAVAVVVAWYWHLAVLVAAVLDGLALVITAVRVARLPSGARRYWPLARWYQWGWPRLAANLWVAFPDRHRDSGDSWLPGKTLYPRARFTADPYGFVVRLKTIPGVARAEMERSARYLTDAWKAVRVSVSQPRPGCLVLRACRREPLAELLSASVLPVFDGRRVVLGRDEWGQMRSADLANLSGSAFSGSPGRGKTEAALSLAVQLAPSPLVDTWILDGGALDWAPFADGAAGYVADDLEAAEDMLRVLDALMCDRRHNLQAVRGARNGWAPGLGPDGDYRLQWVLVEEAPFYLDELAVKGDRKREGHVRACRALLAGLLRRGRAPLFHTTLIAQKGTGTAGLPPDLRDLCALRWSFGVATTEAAAAILGDDIRQHDTASPTLLQTPEMVGVASVLLSTGQSPYTLVRFPQVGRARADQAAATLAARRLAVPELETAGA